MSNVEILGTREMRWPDRNGPWVLRLAFGIIGDRPGVVGVELYAVDPAKIKKAAKGYPALGHKPTGAEAITTTGVRLPLAELTAEYLASIEHSDRIMSQAIGPAYRPEWRKAAEDRLRLIEGASRERRGPGRPAIYGREHFERVAAIYLAALRAGRPPTEAIEKEIAGTSRSAATKWVAKARELGLLPETVKGKAAGWPTTQKQRRTRSGK